jgi:hypothetical protein
VTVSGEGGVRAEQRNMRERAMAEVGLTLGRTELVGLTPARQGLMGRSARSTWATAHVIIWIYIRKNHLKNKTNTTN